MNNNSDFLILMYHSISDFQIKDDKRYTTPVKKFITHINFFRFLRYSFVSLKDIAFYLSGDRILPPRSLALTFDDGYIDFYNNAFPILMRHNIPTTVFIVSNYIGQSNAWDIGKNYAKRDLLNWDHVRRLNKNGIEIGGHSCTHPYLTAINPHAAYKEILDCKAMIEEHLGESISHFSYPYGASSEMIRESVIKSGFLTACGITPGFNNLSSDPFSLRRIEIYGSDSLRQLWQKLRFGKNIASWTFLLKYLIKRIKA